jgi:hypothetical protein
VGTPLVSELIEDQDEFLEVYSTRGGNLVLLTGGSAAPRGSAERYQVYRTIRELADDQALANLDPGARASLLEVLSAKLGPSVSTRID